MEAHICFVRYVRDWLDIRMVMLVDTGNHFLCYWRPSHLFFYESFPSVFCVFEHLFVVVNLIEKGIEKLFDNLPHCLCPVVQRKLV